MHKRVVAEATASTCHDIAFPAKRAVATFEVMHLALLELTLAADHDEEGGALLLGNADVLTCQ